MTRLWIQLLCYAFGQMRVTHTSRHTAPPEKVIEVLCSAAYNLEVERARDGVVETHFEQVSRDEHRAVFRLLTLEHARTKTGGIDRSRSLRSITESDFNFEKREMGWRYESEEGSRVRISGSVLVAPEHGGSRVVQAVDIEVAIPLLGGQIAKLISREMEGKTLPATANVLARHLG